MESFAAVVFAFLCVCACAKATELTFDMEPHERQCFMEHVVKDVDVTVEYQVCGKIWVEGGGRGVCV